MLFNIYIDGLSDILNASTIGGSIGSNRINHILYADDLYIVNFLLQVFSNYFYNAVITVENILYIFFNVNKSVCTGCAKKKKDILNIYVKSLIINIFF